jgi:hypothetical protein
MVNLYCYEHLLINKSECVSLCVCVCMYFKKKLYIYIYILLVSASLLRFLIIATIETRVSKVDEHNVSL